MDNSVDISEKTYALLAKRAEEKDFDTTEGYVNYVLDQVAEKAKKKMTDQGQEFNDEDEKKVKQRLKDLGYMD